MTKEIFKDWDTAYKNDLPDSSFAYISDGGKKDSEGKTTPRSLRHLPYKDKDGKPDLPHVRNALARLDQTDIPASAKPAIKKKLEDILAKSKASEMLMPVSALKFDDSSVDIPDVIQVIPIGSWDHDTYGPMTITPPDIREFVQNFNQGIRKGVFITAGHEGFQELPAVGWITKVEARDDGLWGSVAWNDNGKEALSDKQFKFFSPEFYRDYEDPESHQIYRNVLTGGALTKSPYFKELEAVVFSESKIKNNFNNTDKKMTKTLDEVLALDVATLTDEDKAVLKENEATLTDEQKAKYFPVEKKEETAEEKTAREEKEKGDAFEAEGKNRDGSEKVAASEKKNMVQISAAELEILRNKADQGANAFKELTEKKLGEQVSALIFSETNKVGKFLPKSKDNIKAFMETLNDAQKAKFTSLLSELPKTQVFGEVGVGAGASEGTAKAELDLKITEKMTASEKAGKAMKYSDALKEVMSENPDLETRYDKELVGVKGKGAKE